MHTSQLPVRTQRTFEHDESFQHVMATRLMSSTPPFEPSAREPHGLPSPTAGEPAATRGPQRPWKSRGSKRSLLRLRIPHAPHPPRVADA